jgi:hypothetical protein
VGLETKSVTVTGTTLNVTLTGSGETLQDVDWFPEPTRTVTESAVPIDVISMKEILLRTSSKFEPNYKYGSTILYICHKL